MYKKKKNKNEVDLARLFADSLFGNHNMEPKRIRAIRASYKMTQGNFSELIMVNYETYRSWEEARRFPSSPGVAILFIAEKHPKIFLDNRKEILEKFKKAKLL